jgi:hypothetical protein
MLKLPLSVFLAALVLTGSAAAYSLKGTYKATITGKPAPLDGHWNLEFLAKGVVHTLRNGKLVVIGKAVPTGTRKLVLSDRSGSYACSPSEGKGTYVYRFAGNRLIFMAVADQCVGRKLVLTTKPFVK